MQNRYEHDRHAEADWDPDCLLRFLFERSGAHFNAGVEPGLQSGSLTRCRNHHSRSSVEVTPGVMTSLENPCNDSVGNFHDGLVGGHLSGCACFQPAHGYRFAGDNPVA